MLLMSGKAFWELDSATDAGVGTLLSMLAAAWDNFRERRKINSYHNAKSSHIAVQAQWGSTVSDPL